jgi:hypothetical protein
MTPEEAKGKWCCQFKEVKCSNIDCMAWRWSRSEETAKFLIRIKELMENNGKHMGEDLVTALINEPKSNQLFSEPEHEYGYCGLAGKPE